MAKVDVGFRFSPEADARLKELASIWDQTRTAWLEEMIMSFDLESEREAAAEGRSEAAPQVYGEPPGGKALNPPPLDVTPKRERAPDLSAMPFAKDKWKK